MRLNKLVIFIVFSFVIFSFSVLLSQANKSYHISYIFSGGGGTRVSDNYSQFDVNCEHISGYRYSTNYKQIDGFLSCDSIPVDDTIYVSIHDTIAYYNTTFLYPVYVSNADSVDPQVEAYAFTLTYDDSTLLKATGVETDGTLTEDGWITIVDTSVCSQITVTGASVGYLSGEGVLVFIEFDVYSPSKNDSIVNLQVTQFLFNEGNPIANIDSASSVLNIIPYSVDNPAHNIYFELGQNYPNPFKKSSIISYVLPKSSNVKLQIYNLKGQLIQTLINEDKPAGYHTVEWNVPEKSGMVSGIYFYKLSTKDKTFIKKMILLR